MPLRVPLQPVPVLLNVCASAFLPAGLFFYPLPVDFECAGCSSLSSQISELKRYNSDLVSGARGSSDHLRPFSHLMCLCILSRAIRQPMSNLPLLHSNRFHRSREREVERLVKAAEDAKDELQEATAARLAAEKRAMQSDQDAAAARAKVWSLVCGRL